MPRFEPFPGVRYDLAGVTAADVTAPPYDVLDADDRAALVARHHPSNAGLAGTGAGRAIEDVDQIREDDVNSASAGAGVAWSPLEQVHRLAEHDR